VASVALVAGDNVITVRARDSAGNVGTDAITVSYDGTAPTCAITTPTASPTYASSSSIAGLLTPGDHLCNAEASNRSFRSVAG
jgi:hypothetical protein